MMLPDGLKLRSWIHSSSNKISEMAQHASLCNGPEYYVIAHSAYACRFRSHCLQNPRQILNWLYTLRSAVSEHVTTNVNTDNVFLLTHVAHSPSC